MATYSEKERRIAKALSSLPLLKTILKKGYTLLNYCLYALNSPRLVEMNGTLHRMRDLLPTEFHYYETFDGYYDKYPMNSHGVFLMNATLHSTKKKPVANHIIHVLVVDAFRPNKVLLDIESRAYNWQQGCRAHWLNDDHFILNDFDSIIKCYVARVFSVTQLKEVKRFNYPVQDSFCTDYFLSINYKRINTLRPDYGYRNLPNMTDAELRQLDNDGIWKVDYQTGKTVLLYSLEQVAYFGTKQVDLDAFHKVNHLMINRAGDKFIFIHRYLKNGVRFDRLLLADMQGNLLRVLANNEMVSHCCWLNENTVFAYLRGIDNVDSYYSIDTQTGNMTLLNNALFKKYGDGHPSSNGHFILSDSYPDKALHQHLLLYDMKSGEAKELGSFFHGLRYDEETRCDLHPRLSPDAKRVFFDSVYSGKRQLYYIDID